MPNKTLQDIADSERSIIASETSRSIKKIHDSIKGSVVNSILPENIFIEYFLDFFRYPDKHKDSPLLSKWIELSGGPYNEVSIVDADGIKLYDVPGAYMPPAPDFKKLSSYNFSNIASQYQMKKAITVTHATNYISSILSTVPELLRPNVNKYINRWVSIFARYDIATPDSSKKINTKASVTNDMDLTILDI